MVDMVALVVGKTVCREAPACNGCRWELTRMAIHQPCRDNRDYYRRSLVDLAPLQGFYSTRGAQMGHDAGLALVCLLPQFMFEVFFAKPFDMTAYADSVDYEFTSKDHAVEFATLNCDAEWVKVNGEIINQ